MESFQTFELSSIYIDLATRFQSLNPYQQTEYLQLLQDEYADVLNGSDMIDELDEIERRVVERVLYLFYSQTESKYLATKLERFVHELIEQEMICVEWLITFGNVFIQYMNDVSNS